MPVSSILVSMIVWSAWCVSSKSSPIHVEVESGAFPPRGAGGVCARLPEDSRSAQVNLQLVGAGTDSPLYSYLFSTNTVWPLKN